MLEMEKQIVESPSHSKVLIPQLDFRSLKTQGTNKSPSKSSTPNSAASQQNSASIKQSIINNLNNSVSQVPEKKFEVEDEEEMILKAKRASSPRLLSQKVSLSSKIMPLPKSLKRPNPINVNPTSTVQQSNSPSSTKNINMNNSPSSTKNAAKPRAVSPTLEKNIKQSNPEIAEETVPQQSNLTIADLANSPAIQQQPQQAPPQSDSRLSTQSSISLSSNSSHVSTSSSIKKAIASYINIHPDKSLSELVHMTKPVPKNTSVFTSGRSSASLKYDPGYISPKMTKLSAAFASGSNRFQEDRSTSVASPPPTKYDPYPELAIAANLTGMSVISQASGSQNPPPLTAAFRSSSPRLVPPRSDSPNHTYIREITPNIIDLKKQFEEKKKSKKDFIKAVLGKDVFASTENPANPPTNAPSAAFAGSSRFENTKNCLPTEKFLSVKANVQKLIHEKDIVKRKTFSIYDKELTPGPGSYHQPTLPDSIYYPSK